MILNFFFILALCFLQLSCQSRGPQQKTAEPSGTKVDFPFSLNFKWNPHSSAGTSTKHSSPSLIKTVVQAPCFVHDISQAGQILLSCTDQKIHSHFELYTLLVGQDKIRRTYQDQNIMSARWIENDRIVYSSAKDEFKEEEEHYIHYLKTKYLNLKNENSEAISPNSLISTHRSPSEIYQLNLKDKSDRRLTWIKGSNEVVGIDKKKSIIFISTLKKETSPKISQETSQEASQETSKEPTTETTRVQALSAKLKLKEKWSIKEAAFQVTLSADQKKAAWVFWDYKSLHTHIKIYDVVSQTIDELKIDKGRHWQPRWHPSQPWLVFSGQKAGEKFLNIYVANIERSCIEKVELVGIEAQDAFSPVFGLSGDTIYLSIWKRNSVEVLQLPFAPTSTCFTSGASIN